jgi:hypothetical protein
MNPEHPYPPRQSLDSRRARLQTRNTNSSVGTPPLPRPATPMEDEAFEDVGLNDEPSKPANKKRGFLSRFGGDGPDASNQTSRPTSGYGHFHFGVGGGRKRGQSGSGEELGNMKRDSRTPEVKIESA